MNPNTIVHIQRHPYYGAAENAFNTINKDLGDYTHVFVELCPPEEKDKFYLHAVSDISRRADYNVTYCGNKLFFNHVACTIAYDLNREEIDGKVETDGKLITWEIERKLNEPDISVRADVPIYPMLDTDRISAITGKISKPTIGILYDPNVPGFNSDIISVVAESLDEKHRLIVTRPDCLYKNSKIPEILEKKYKCEIIQRPYTIGFDWSIESLCSIVISDYSLNPGTYGYMCATAMAMGKLLICDKHGDYAKYSTDRVSAIHFDDYNVIPKYIAWAETHKDKADKLRAAAMYQIYNQDKDPNLHKLRGIMGCL